MAASLNNAWSIIGNIHKQIDNIAMKFITRVYYSDIKDRHCGPVLYAEMQDSANALHNSLPSLFDSRKEHLLKSNDSSLTFHELNSMYMKMDVEGTEGSMNLHGSDVHTIKYKMLIHLRLEIEREIHVFKTTFNELIYESENPKDILIQKIRHGYGGMSLFLPRGWWRKMGLYLDFMDRSDIDD